MRKVLDMNSEESNETSQTKRGFLKKVGVCTGSLAAFGTINSAASSPGTEDFCQTGCTWDLDGGSPGCASCDIGTGASSINLILYTNSSGGTFYGGNGDISDCDSSNAIAQGDIVSTKTEISFSNPDSWVWGRWENADPYKMEIEICK